MVDSHRLSMVSAKSASHLSARMLPGIGVSDEDDAILQTFAEEDNAMKKTMSRTFVESVLSKVRGR